MKPIPYWFKQLFSITLLCVCIVGFGYPAFNKLISYNIIANQPQSNYDELLAKGAVPKDIVLHGSRSGSDDRIHIIKEWCGLISDFVTIIFSVLPGIYSVMLWIKRRRRREDNNG